MCAGQTLLSFKGPVRTLKVGGADLVALRREFGDMLPGWSCESEPGEDTPDITVTRVGQGYEVNARFPGCEAMPASDIWEAGYQATSALFLLTAAAVPDQCVIHAGAVEIDGRLVLFVGDTMAGKSSLALHLAAAGRRVFGDDPMIVAASKGAAPTAMALGLVRKLRLPLPADFDPGAIAYAKALGRDAGDGEVVYLCADPGLTARFGERLPIAAIVMLDRSAGVPAALSLIGAVEAIRRLIGLTVTSHMGAGDQLVLLTRLVGAVPILRLSAPGSRAACRALLAHRFGAAT
jgi:hypothetical protein